MITGLPCKLNKQTKNNLDICGGWFFYTIKDYLINRSSLKFSWHGTGGTNMEQEE